MGWLSDFNHLFATIVGLFQYCTTILFGIVNTMVKIKYSKNLLKIIIFKLITVSNNVIFNELGIFLAKSEKSCEPFSLFLALDNVQV